jgi:hypothetical protein
LLFQDFEHADDGFADIILKLIDRFGLGIAAWDGWDFSPETSVRVFMDDNGIIPQVSISLATAGAV